MNLNNNQRLSLSNKQNQQQQQPPQQQQQQQQQPPTLLSKPSLYRYTETPPTPVNIFTKRTSLNPNSSSSSNTNKNNVANTSNNMTPTTPIQKINSINNTPMRAPRSVTVSAIKPKIHTYPSSPAGTLNSSSGSTNSNNSGMLNDYPMSPYSSSDNNNISQLLNASSFYYSPDDIEDTSQSALEPEVFFMSSGSSSGGRMNPDLASDAARSTPAKVRPKSIKQRIQDIISYPVDKWDEFHEDLLVLYNHPFYNASIYILCIVLNILLFGYSIELFGNFLGFILIMITLLNCLYYIYSSKKVHLYRYQSTYFTSPNMHIESIETPSGSVDNVVALEVWDPKFTSETIFTFFSPLHVALMITAGSDLNRFINNTILSIFISLGIYYLIKKYEGKMRDEKILFAQLCEEYNYQYKPKAFTTDRATQTSR